MVEVAALVAMLATRFDMLPEGNQWIEPGQNLSNVSLQIAQPRKQVKVRIAPRKHLKETSWQFRLLLRIATLIKTQERNDS